mmetsp:Transcript_28610/g.62242  ORF Transcript_28610/g.62242 Transcript_28610/m.62242 type:complete len:556 (-) Transcript_28610:117-1784(-)
MSMHSPLSLLFSANLLFPAISCQWQPVHRAIQFDSTFANLLFEFGNPCYSNLAIHCNIIWLLLIGAFEENSRCMKMNIQLRELLILLPMTMAALGLGSGDSSPTTARAWWPQAASWTSTLPYRHVIWSACRALGCQPAPVSVRCALRPTSSGIFGATTSPKLAAIAHVVLALGLIGEPSSPTWFVPFLVALPLHLVMLLVYDSNIPWPISWYSASIGRPTTHIVLELLSVTEWFPHSADGLPSNSLLHQLAHYPSSCWMPTPMWVCSHHCHTLLRWGLLLWAHSPTQLTMGKAWHCENLLIIKIWPWLPLGSTATRPSMDHLRRLGWIMSFCLLQPWPWWSIVLLPQAWVIPSSWSPWHDDVIIALWNFDFDTPCDIHKLRRHLQLALIDGTPSEWPSYDEILSWLRGLLLLWMHGCLNVLTRWLFQVAMVASLACDDFWNCCVRPTCDASGMKAFGLQRPLGRLVSPDIDVERSEWWSNICSPSVYTLLHQMDNFSFTLLQDDVAIGVLQDVSTTVFADDLARSQQVLNTWAVTCKWNLGMRWIFRPNLLTGEV